VVIEQAKKLVSLDEFKDQTNSIARIEFLYERIYQRQPRQQEIQLGLDFVARSPEISNTSENLLFASNGGNIPSRPGLKEGRLAALKEKRAEKRGITPISQQARKRLPLTGWQEYAHALLQANELSFVN
jgi:hypothetical protein